MKTFTFLGAITLLSFQGISQITSNVNSAKAELALPSNWIETPSPAIDENSTRNTIWENNFNDPTEWTIGGPAGFSETNGFSIVSTGGTWFFTGNNIINSASGGNYARFQNGNPTANPPTTVNAGGHTLTYNNSIDLNGINAAIEFNQFGARFSEIQAVQISLNNGVSWITVGTNNEIPALTSTGGAAYPNPQKRVYNLFPFTEGQDASNVLIRFFWDGAMNGPAISYVSYGWFIDDVKIVEAPENDLILLNGYHGDIINDFQFSNIPLSQVIPISLSADVRNFGSAQQSFVVEYDIKRNNQIINSGSFPSILLNSLEDTLIAHNTNFTPTETGNYSVDYRVVGGSGEEATPSDNLGSSNFVISQFVYSSVGPITRQVSFSGAEAPFELNRLGNLFNIYNDVTLHSVNVAFGPGTSPQAAVIVQIWEVAASFTEVGSITIYDLVPSNINLANGSNYTKIILETPIQLDAGKLYLATIESDNPNRVVFQASTGNDDFGVLLYGPFGTGSAVGWFSGVFDFKPAINLDFENSTSIENINDELSNFSIFPNPSADLTRIELELQGNSNVSIHVIDINGKIVMQENLGKQNDRVNYLLNTSILSSGIYNVQVITNNTFSSKRLIISK